MSHYDGRERHREYDYWTGERVREYLEAHGGVDQFCIAGDGLYGMIEPGGSASFCVDDDDDRAEAVVRFLTRIGARGFSRR